MSVSEGPGQKTEVSVDRSERTISDVARTGHIVEFDEHVGLGRVEADDGTRYLFHCVEIADGSRTIEIGARVEFDLMVKLGSPEAANLRPEGR